MRHRTIRLMLYDYVRGELGENDERLVEKHVARCAGCAGEAAALRSVLKVVPDAARRPSDTLPESYWKGFANEVMGRIGPGPVADVGLIGRIAGRLAGARHPAGRISAAWKLSLGLAAAVIAGGVLYLAVSPPAGGPADSGTERIAERRADGAWPGTGEGPAGGDAGGDAGGVAGGFSADSLTQFDRRLDDYFRRSKVLLVGVSNLEPADEGTADLVIERSISLSLLGEARYLRTGPVDARSYRLLEDLDKIMIGLANSDARSAAPTVEIIRDGIRARNLLFKLRMQEARNYPARFMQASYRQ
jgi:hypothetical protein